jgi:hypothetical protein
MPSVRCESSTALRISTSQHGPVHGVVLPIEQVGLDRGGRVARSDLCALPAAPDGWGSRAGRSG